MHPGPERQKQTVTLFLTVLEIVAPVFLLAALGFGWVRMGFDYPVEFITRLGMTLAVPCLIFTALMKTEIALADLGQITLVSIAGYGALTVVFRGVMSLLGLERRTYFVPLTFGNTGNLGLPLALFAFGEVGLGYAVVVFAVGVVWMFTFGLWLMAKHSNPLRNLREPMLIASLLGALFLWQGWETPRPLTNALDLLGQMAIPLMLLTLGVAVGRLSPGHVKKALGLSVLKVVLCAATGFAVALALGLGPVPTGVLVVQLATPVPVTVYLLAQKYDTDPEAVAGMVVVSTLLAVGALPLILALVL